VSEIADNAANHSFTKHVINQKEFPGINSVSELSKKASEVIYKPTHSKVLTNGRSAFYNSGDNTLVIYNSATLEASTVFKPTEGISYYTNSLK
jgi:filamentous hemagglutinin